MPDPVIHIMPGKQNLDITAGQHVVLSPSSPQFQHAYQIVHPQTIDQVREILSSAVPQRATVRRRLSPAVTALAAKPIHIQDLHAPHAGVLRAARTQAYQVAHEYVHHPDVSSLAAWKPVLDQYLVLSKATLNLAVLLDINIADGATLTISKNTHALYARNVTIHGHGKIVCQGKCSFKLKTLKGV